MANKKGPSTFGTRVFQVILIGAAIALFVKFGLPKIQGLITYYKAELPAHNTCNDFMRTNTTVIKHLGNVTPEWYEESNAKFVENEYAQKIATLSYNVQGSRGKGTMSFRLIMEEAGWKVESAQLKKGSWSSGELVR